MTARAPSALLACVAALVAGAAHAAHAASDRGRAGGAPPGGDLAALVDGGRANLGRRTRLSRLRCADTGGAGFVCQTVYRGRVVAVGARRTGDRTPAAAARRFSTECGGLVAFDNPACTFDVEVTPSGTARGSVDAGGGKRPLVTIDADSFDLF